MAAAAAAEIVFGLTGRDHISPQDKWARRYVESFRVEGKQAGGKIIGRDVVNFLMGGLNEARDLNASEAKLKFPGAQQFSPLYPQSIPNNEH